MITEGNISNIERVGRQVKAIVQSYKPKLDLDTISVQRSTKGNWLVKDGDGKRICIISKFLLSEKDACELGYIECKEVKESIDGIVDKDKIIDELENLGIYMKKCIINDNGVVDLIDDVTIHNKSIKELKVQFGKCEGDFDISNCKRLISLAGCPDEVAGDFICSGCSIRDFMGGPDYVKGHFISYECTDLVSCKGSPIKVDGNFYLGNLNYLKIDLHDIIKLEKSCKIKGEIY